MRQNRGNGEEPQCDREGQRDQLPTDRAPPSSARAAETVELHRLLVESVRNYAIIALDRTGHVLTWNPGAERYFGWNADEIIGQRISHFYPPADVTAGKPELLLREAERKGSAEEEGWRVRKNGTWFWADDVITTLRDRDSCLIGFAKVTRDLTDRRETQERLRESEERFRLIVQSVKDYAIFMLDADGHVTTWNEGAERIKGYTADEIIGRHFSIFYPYDRVIARYPQYELKQARLHGRFEDEGWRVRKDGSLFWASVVITPLFNSERELIGYAKVTRDLTERKQAQERALADARRVAEIEAASSAKSEFLTTLSHDLRTPLNAIGGYVDLMSAEVYGPISDVYHGYLNRIKTSQQHLLALVNDLLNLSKIESGQVDFDLVPIPVPALFGDLEAIIVPMAKAKGVSVVRGDCPADAVVRADFSRTQQILLNLLTNAVKYTEPGGKITLSCACSSTDVAISVSDTGPGIPAEKHEAIFQPFVQLGRSLTSIREGVGLGLAISRDLARGMSGDLRLSSRVGEGSTFTLVLPRVTKSSE